MEIEPAKFFDLMEHMSSINKMLDFPTFTHRYVDSNLYLLARDKSE